MIIDLINIFFSFTKLLCNRCIHVNTGIEMSEEYCDWTVRPDGVNLCTIACPGDCVLSGWSDWSPCPKVIMYTFLFII